LTFFSVEVEPVNTGLIYFLKEMKSETKSVKNAWAMYDWANSVFSLVITSAVFPIYYSAVTRNGDTHLVNFLGIECINTALYSYALSVSFLIVAILSPVLSAIADISGNKKMFMKIFCYMGAASCISLYFFTGDNVEWGIFMFMLGNIGFTGSIVFYNAFLPEIAESKEFDKLSAKGFALGYIGSAILLIISLVLITQPQLFGIEDNSFAPRFAFVLTGLWWIGFAQITFSKLKDTPVTQKPEGYKYLFNGFRELKLVFKQVQNLKMLKYYLLAFFLYSMGVQTVMYMATLFGDKELKLESTQLIITILIIQFVGVAGSYGFSWLSSKFGNIRALLLAVFIWIGVCIFAYFIHTANEFFGLAFVVGLIMGGIQSLSRSTYAKLLPETNDHASFFSFFDVTEKIAIVGGTFAYGLVEQLSGSMRISALVLMVFFIGGALMMIPLLNRKSLKALEPLT